MNKNKGRTKAELPPIIKIALVDDHQLFRDGVAALLKDYEELRVVIEAGNGSELLKQLRQKQPHVVLLDIQMPGEDGIEITKILTEKYPALKIIILSMNNEDVLIFDAIAGGAHGFLPKDKTVEEVVDAIYSVMENGRYYSERVANALALGTRGIARSVSYPASRLTAKEVEVLRWICRQKTNKEIASSLGVSTRTVESQRNSILQKTGTRNTAGLVVYALKNKLISLIDLE